MKVSILFIPFTTIVSVIANKIKKFMKDQQKANEAIAKELGLIK